MSAPVMFQALPPLSPEEYSELERYADDLAGARGFAPISTSEIGWFFATFQSVAAAKAAIGNAMWRDAHPGWRANRMAVGQVYFIGAPEQGLVKIGYTQDVGGRFRAIAGMSPSPLRLLATIGGGRDVESELHSRFSEWRRHGEWFVLAPAIAAFIAEVTQ